MNKAWGAVRAAATGMMLIGGLAIAVPAQAQFSDGYKLLEAVRKLDGDTVTNMLADPGINVNTKDGTTGETPLHIVVRKQNAIWVAFLLQNHANPNIADSRGITPLMLAVNLGFIDGVTTLIGGGASVETPDSTGETPLILAVHRRDPAMVRTLLKAGANPDRSDNSGRTARDYASLDGRQNPVLSEIDASTKAKAAGAKGKSFGPSIP